MSNKEYRIFYKDDGGFNFTIEADEKDVAEIMATFKCVVLGKSIVVLSASMIILVLHTILEVLTTNANTYL